MKHTIFTLFLVTAISCSGDLFAGYNDPYGGNGQSQGQGQNQSTDPPAEIDPTSSGVTVDDETTSEDNIANTDVDGEISITFSESDAAISGSVDGVSVQKNGARVTVTNSGKKTVK